MIQRILFNSGLFKIDVLSSLVLLGVIFFTVLILLYSIGFMRGKPGRGQYYTYIILTSLASLAVCLTNNLVFLLVAWGFLGITLYLLIALAGPQAREAAKKTLIIVGGADALMVLAAAIIYCLTGTLEMDKIRISLSASSLLPVLAYLCLALACFAKAGAMPLHTWIPDCAENAPLPVTAFLPASLDKLLGIYLLARVSLDMFVMSRTMNMFLMLAGAFTIVAAVMMALIQHNMKRLLGYHAVSQVGYMVLGIGTGIPVGVAGGIFHMLNNAVYKSCLFLTAGSVEQRAKTSQLDALGGLSRLMPLTYISSLIASLSISGVPPFNGFISKWMVYQGLIGNWRLANGKWEMSVYLLCLVAAVFGSALTLASFLKLLHAVFLGQGEVLSKRQVREVSAWMWFPQLVLALLCIVFGIFAYQVPLKYFIGPAVGNNIEFFGLWAPALAAILLFVGMLAGLLIYCSGNIKQLSRRDKPYVGTEDIPAEARPTGTEFYRTVKEELGVLRGIYRKAEAGAFDIYHQAKDLIFGVTNFLRYLHNGVLPTYLVWCLLGMMGIFYLFLK